MMSAISTASLFASLQANMATTQNQIADDTDQVASQQVSQNLAGYGAQAGTLTAVNTVSSRLTSYVANAQALSGKLAVQDQALSQVETSAQSARSSVAEALANGSGAALMTSLQGQMTAAASALNTQYQGQYLFSGGQSNTAPFAATSLADIAAAAPLSTVFKNGSTPQVARIDDNTVIQTGVLASDAGTPLMTALAAIQSYNAGPNGPLSGPLSTQQTSFLTTTLSQLDSALSAATTVVANNGVVQQNVTDATTRLTDQQTTMAGVVSNLVTPDEAQVASQLSLAQTTLQASAEIFSSLQDDSLLKVLGVS